MCNELKGGPVPALVLTERGWGEDMGSAVITQQEMVDIDLSVFPRLNTDEQVTLSLLKDKDAPIEGILMLKFREGYEVTRRYDHMTYNTHFHWHKVS